MNEKKIESLIVLILLVCGLGLLAILITSCSTQTGITYGSVTEYADGTVRTEQVNVSAPVSAKSASFIEPCTNGLRIAVSGSQSVADLAKAKGEQRNKGFLYAGCGLLVLIGGIALALPNNLVSNKDALLVLGAGAASGAIVMWSESASSVMKWVLPALIVSAILYVGWLCYFKSKQEQ